MKLYGQLAASERRTLRLGRERDRVEVERAVLHPWRSEMNRAVRAYIGRASHILADEDFLPAPSVRLAVGKRKRAGLRQYRRLADIELVTDAELVRLSLSRDALDPLEEIG